MKILARVLLGLSIAWSLAIIIGNALDTYDFTQSHSSTGPQARIGFHQDERSELTGPAKPQFSPKQLEMIVQGFLVSPILIRVAWLLDVSIRATKMMRIAINLAVLNILLAAALVAAFWQYVV